MARFNAEIPNDIIREVEKREKNSHKMIANMTRAGAEVVLKKVKSKAPGTINKFAKISKTYETPSDQSINTKVYISGYLPFRPPRTTFSRRNGHSETLYVTDQGIPADFLAILYEYGRSTSPFPKKPFLRSAFNKKDIEQAMLEEQKKYIKE